MTVTRESELRERLKAVGWCLFAEMIDSAFIEELSHALDEAHSVCRAIQIRNGLPPNTDGTVHHLVAFKGVFLDLLGRGFLTDELLDYFGGQFILNSFGGVINRKAAPSYVCNIHRDTRSFTGDLPLMANVLVMLDDFTLDNGATYLLAGSHRQPDKPSEIDFFAGADRATAPKGSFLLFNSNLWHAAGLNHTDSPRRCLTLTFTKPYIKQQLDYPRLVGHSQINELTTDLRQILGYNARVPASLEEWYQPADQRYYRADQG